MDAVRLEMKTVRIAFDEHHGDIDKLVGYEEITGHLVFDVKLGENFRRKARFCADGHKTKAPAAVTYSAISPRVDPIDRSEDSSNDVYKTKKLEKKLIE